jgi:hypothetical protein
MRLLGFFAELHDGEHWSYTGSILEATRPVSLPDETSILEYLKQGLPVVDFMEATQDVINRDQYVLGGSSILTDGVWLWREDLSHYLARYHLQLDSDFLHHAAANSYRTPKVPPDVMNQIIDEVTETLLR